ncbi:Short chain dehydrogenase [Lachnellula willkommii]|uniref:Short chain dehydrogenase n=1 Tax=Lachnellula willkommii TaxID=215461 RepID=A0A559M4R3_9HELO|nr:Short chain dehydrogenase [Lachnellula willkommii]
MQLAMNSLSAQHRCGPLETSRWVVHLGASRVILACRNISKGLAAAKDIQAMTGCSSDTLDVKTELPRLDVLIANAGINSHTFQMIKDNEAMITMNVISLFLLGFLLYPKLREAAAKYKTQTHFTTTSSDLNEIANFDEHKAPPGWIFAPLNDETKFSAMDRYPTSRLLELIIVKQMATLLPLNSNNVIINCVSPGTLGRTTEVGSRSIVHGASSGGESHGQCLPDCKIERPTGLCQGEKAAEIQSNVWEELKGKLEAIQPGVTTVS